MFGIPDELVQAASGLFSPTPAATAPMHSHEEPGHPHEPETDLFSSVGHLISGIGRDAMDLVDVEAQLDRAEARSELANRFEIANPTHHGPRHPNTISADEYEQVVRLYSDIRRGAGDLSIDPAMTQSPQDPDGTRRQVHLSPLEQPAWQTGTLDDIATMLQTPVGREELALLNANPLHHHTTIGPHLNTKAQLDPENAYSLATDYPASLMLPHGQPNTGSNTRVHMNPHTNIMRSDPNWGVRGNEWMESNRSDVIGMHELTHALYQTLGLDDGSHVRQHDAGPKQHHNHSSRGVRIDASFGERREEHQGTALGRYASAPWGENPYRMQRLQMPGAVGEVLRSAGNHDGDADMTIRDSYNGRQAHR